MEKLVLSVFIALLIASCDHSPHSPNKAIVNGDSVDAARNKILDSVRAERDYMGNPKYSTEDSVADAAVKKYEIKMVEGKHKYGGKTKISYLNVVQLINEEKANARREMTPEDELATNISNLKFTSRGGRLRIDVSRNTVGAAEMENFSIVIQDIDGKELFRQDCEDRPVGGYSSVDDMWWSLDLLRINKKIRPPFNVFVIDRISADKPFKFSVTPITK